MPAIEVAKLVLFVIVGAGVVAAIVALKIRHARAKERAFAAFGAEAPVVAGGVYISGHPAITRSQPVDFVRAGGDLLIIPSGGTQYLGRMRAADITAVEVVDKTTIEREQRVTVTRVALVGIFALAFPKNTTKTSEAHLLTLQWHDQGMLHTGGFRFSGFGSLNRANAALAFLSESRTRVLAGPRIERALPVRVPPRSGWVVAVSVLLAFGYIHSELQKAPGEPPAASTGGGGDSASPATAATAEPHTEDNPFAKDAGARVRALLASLLGQRKQQIEKQLGKPRFDSDDYDGFTTNDAEVRFFFVKGKAERAEVLAKAGVPLWFEDVAPIKSKAGTFEVKTMSDPDGWTFSSKAWWDWVPKREALLKKKAEEQAAKEAVSEREMVAYRMERAMREGNVAVRVSAIGGEKRTLHIRYVLCSETFMLTLSNDRKLYPMLRSAGFNRIQCFDGYDESWSGNL